jgi:hypothetical protein
MDASGDKANHFLNGPDQVVYRPIQTPHETKTPPRLRGFTIIGKPDRRSILMRATAMHWASGQPEASQGQHTIRLARERTKLGTQFVCLIRRADRYSS